MAMPAALEVDHDKVRTVAMVVGVREAARQFGLPEDAVRQWSKREGWFKHKQVAEAAILKKQENQGLSPNVTKSGSEALATLGNKSKLLGAKVGHSMLKNMSKVKGLAQVSMAQPFAQTVGALAKVHGWGSESQSSAPLVAIQLNGYVPPEAK